MSLISALGALAGCGDDAPTAVLDPLRDQRIVDVRVVDGLGGVAEHQDVLLQGGRIVSVGPTGSGGGPAAEQIAGAGMTLLPGFIDAHTHLGGVGAALGDFQLPTPERNLEAWLRAGVTTVYDLGGRLELNLDFAARTAAGTLAGPRIFTAGKSITARGGHPIPAAKAFLPWPLSAGAGALVIQVDGPEDAEAAVADAAKGGSALIKILSDSLPPGAPELSPETVGALVAAAHARGLPAFVHVGTEAEALVAARAGADVLAHGIYRGGLSAAGAAEIAALGVTVIPTLTGFLDTAAMSEGAWLPTPLDASLGWEPLYAPILGDGGKAFGAEPTLGAFARGIDRDMGAGVSLMYQAGVPLLVGSDAPIAAVYAGSAYHRELVRLVACGIPPLEVLSMATGRAARLLVAEPDFGAIGPGMVADLVLVEGDPTQDIRAASNIVGVWRQGRQVRVVAAP